MVESRSIYGTPEVEDLETLLDELIGFIREMAVNSFDCGFVALVNVSSERAVRSVYLVPVRHVSASLRT